MLLAVVPAISRKIKSKIQIMEPCGHQRSDQSSSKKISNSQVFENDYECIHASKSLIPRKNLRITWQKSWETCEHINPRKSLDVENSSLQYIFFIPFSKGFEKQAAFFWLMCTTN